MNQNCTEQQSRQDQTIYSRIERVIAYKNIQFILEHQAVIIMMLKMN